MHTHGKANGALASLATFVLFASCLIFGAATASAQETTGTLRGTVTDVNGAVVSGATVTLTNEATGAQQTKQSTGDGIFEFSKLAPGSYTVTIEATGFKRALNKEVSVKLGIVNPLDIKLEPGAVSETVTVTAGTEEIVQRDQSQISHTVETRKIEDCRLMRRCRLNPARLDPGGSPNNSGGVNTNGSGLSVNGNRARSNNFQIDGSDNNDLSVAGPALFVDAQDSLQEYQVITNNFSAQYGRNQGAIVNLVTKGGTNDFHGTAFEYIMTAGLWTRSTILNVRVGRLNRCRVSITYSVARSAVRCTCRSLVKAARATGKVRTRRSSTLITRASATRRR
jgi:hypothetical protein